MTSLFKILAGLALAATLSACGSSHTASRAAMPDDTMLGFIQPDYRIDSFTVSVPRSLEVNEKNSYLPKGDIVWHGDMSGDRHEQVKAIFETALTNAVFNVQGNRPVRVDIQVLRFHGVSDKARYKVGGIHDIDFNMRIVDAVSGMPLGPTKVVRADLEAMGGMAAVAAESRGETQKVRVTHHLTNVITSELTVPGGHVNAKLGLLQRLNDI